MAAVAVAAIIVLVAPSFTRAWELQEMTPLETLGLWDCHHPSSAALIHVAVLMLACYIAMFSVTAPPKPGGHRCRWVLEGKAISWIPIRLLTLPAARHRTVSQRDDLMCFPNIFHYDWKLYFFSKIRKYPDFNECKLIFTSNCSFMLVKDALRSFYLINGEMYMLLLNEYWCINAAFYCSSRWSC